MKNESINSGEPLTEEQEIGILMNASKKRKDAIEAYRIGNRQDLLEKEQQELEIIQQYLPKQLSDEEIEEKITEIIELTGASSLKDLGKVMSEAMKELKGKVDGKKVRQIARLKLA